MALKNSVRHGRRNEEGGRRGQSVSPSALTPQRTLKIITAKLFFENGNIDAAPLPLPLNFSPLSTSERANPKLTIRQ